MSYYDCYVAIKNAEARFNLLRFANSSFKFAADKKEPSDNTNKVNTPVKDKTVNVKNDSDTIEAPNLHCRTNLNSGSRDLICNACFDNKLEIAKLKSEIQNLKTQISAIQ